MAGAAQAGDPLPGTYRFPGALGLHHPVLAISRDGRFAFGDGPEVAEDPGKASNHGTWTRSGTTVRLTYVYAECCQFVDIEHEDMRLREVGAEELRVRFRGAEAVLSRVRKSP